MTELIDGLENILDGILEIGSGLLGVVGDILTFAVSCFQEGSVIGILLCLLLLKIVFMIKNGIF